MADNQTPENVQQQKVKSSATHRTKATYGARISHLEKQISKLQDSMHRYDNFIAGIDKLQKRLPELDGLQDKVRYLDSKVRYLDNIANELQGERMLYETYKKLYQRRTIYGYDTSLVMVILALIVQIGVTLSYHLVGK